MQVSPLLYNIYVALALDQDLIRKMRPTDLKQNIQCTRICALAVLAVPSSTAALTLSIDVQYVHVYMYSRGGGGDCASGRIKKTRIARDKI